MRYFVFCLLGASIALLFLMFWMASITPHHDDLYGLIYGHGFSHQAENTYVFMLGFPAMALVLSIFLVRELRRSGASMPAARLSVILPAAICLFFLTGGFYRFIIVQRYFGFHID